MYSFFPFFGFLKLGLYFKINTCNDILRKLEFKVSLNDLYLKKTKQTIYSSRGYKVLVKISDKFDINFVMTIHEGKSTYIYTSFCIC